MACQGGEKMKNEMISYVKYYFLVFICGAAFICEHQLFVVFFVCFLHVCVSPVRSLSSMRSASRAVAMSSPPSAAT